MFTGVINRVQSSFIDGVPSIPFSCCIGHTLDESYSVVIPELLPLIIIASNPKDEKRDCCLIKGIFSETKKGSIVINFDL